MWLCHLTCSIPVECDQFSQTTRTLYATLKVEDARSSKMSITGYQSPWHQESSFCQQQWKPQIVQYWNDCQTLMKFVFFGKLKFFNSSSLVLNLTTVMCNLCEVAHELCMYLSVNLHILTLLFTRAERVFSNSCRWKWYAHFVLHTFCKCFVSLR